MWLGPAPERPFNKAYLPFVWRGWYDFGCGSFGDMGCYSFAGVFKILDLAPPTAVEASSSESFEETYPKASIVHLEYPAARIGRPIKMSWYDGSIKPERPAGMLKEDEHWFVHSDEGEGVMYVGDKGIILAGFNGDRPRVYPESKKYQTPQRQRSRGPQRDAAIDQWIAACKGGPAVAHELRDPEPGDRGVSAGLSGAALPGRALRMGHGQNAGHEFGEGQSVSGSARAQGVRLKGTDALTVAARQRWRRSATRYLSPGVDQFRDSRIRIALAFKLD